MINFANFSYVLKLLLQKNVSYISPKFRSISHNELSCQYAFILLYKLSVNEKLPVSKLRYFGKYIMQLFGYCYVHVSGQRQADLER